MSNYRLICLGTRPSPYAYAHRSSRLSSGKRKANHTAHTVQKVCVRGVGKSSPMLFSTSDHVLQVRGMLGNASLQTQATDFERRRSLMPPDPARARSC